MWKSIVVTTVLSVMIACLLSGCAYITSATSDKILTNNTEKPAAVTETYLDISTIKIRHRIFCKSIRVSNISMIFSGTTDLADGTILQSQLYKKNIILTWLPTEREYKMLTWWPAEHEYKVKDGNWEIKVLPKEMEASEELLPESIYFLKIWVKDNPAIIDGIIWDTIGPPVPIIADDK